MNCLVAALIITKYVKSNSLVRATSSSPICCFMIQYTHTQQGSLNRHHTKMPSMRRGFEECVSLLDGLIMCLCSDIHYFIDILLNSVVFIFIWFMTIALLCAIASDLEYFFQAVTGCVYLYGLITCVLKHTSRIFIEMFCDFMTSPRGSF